MKIEGKGNGKRVEGLRQRGDHEERKADIGEVKDWQEEGIEGVILHIRVLFYFAECERQLKTKSEDNVNGYFISHIPFSDKPSLGTGSGATIQRVSTASGHILLNSDILYSFIQIGHQPKVMAKIYTNIHTHLHACRYTYIHKQTNTHAYICMYIHTLYVHTYTHTCIHTYKNTYMHK